MNEQTPQSSIESVVIRGLFKRFNHTVKLNTDENLTILTAPNGFGKTAVLRALDAFFSKKFDYFMHIQFDEIEIGFVDGKRIVISSEKETDTDGETTQKNVSIKGFGFGKKSETYWLRPKRHGKSKDRIKIENDLQFFFFENMKHRISDHMYDQKDRTGNWGLLPSQFTGKIKLPPWLIEATQLLRVSLIETQRLLSLKKQQKDQATLEDKRTQAESVVEKNAADLANQMNSVLREYANASQKLDQTFPQRIIENQNLNIETETDISHRLKSLSETRESLVNVGLIDESADGPIQPDHAFKEESVRRILSIYIDDTQKKLSIFTDIDDKIQLFKKILDRYFTFKEIRINRHDGIVVIDTDSHEPIPLSELSSGEQHELVLVYELLFKAPEGSLILIDEPELSLHVAWQKRFISDLVEIKKLRNLSVLIATHSPQIINDKWDLVQELSK